MRAPFHDPLIIPLEGEYLGLSTDLRIPGVMSRTSPDLVTWSEPFPLLPQTPPSVEHLVGTNRFWAPELIRRGDRWRLYYCASRPGKTCSTIGLAESDDPEAAGGSPFPPRFWGDGSSGGRTRGLYFPTPGLRIFYLPAEAVPLRKTGLLSGGCGLCGGGYARH